MHDSLIGRWHGLLLATLVLAVSNAAVAQGSLRIPMQGFLSDGQGVPLDGEHTLEFVLYAEEEGGAALYAETHPSVALDNGRFDVFLGAGDPRASNPHSWGPELFTEHGAQWLYVVIDLNESVEPRFGLGDVPFAVQAYEAEHAKTAGEAAAGSALAHRLSALENDVTALQARLSARHFVGDLAEFEAEGRCTPNNLGTIHDCACDEGSIPVGGGAWRDTPWAVNDAKPHYKAAEGRWYWRVGCIDVETGTRGLCEDVSYWCVPFDTTGPITPGS